MKKIKTAKHKNILEIATSAYIRKVKKWMFCPACQNGKMTINKESTLWSCENCGYTIDADEFEDNYVFWFCDRCNTYLNNQEGFDKNAPHHICKKCGYDNVTTFDNGKGICSKCGKTIPDPDGTLCDDCKQVRKNKAQECIKTVGKVVGVAAAVVGTAYLVSKVSGEDDETNDSCLPDGDDNGETDMRFDHVTDYWMETASEDELRNTASEMEELLDKLDYDSEEHSKIYSIHIDVVNAIASRFPLNLPRREHGWYLPNDD